MPSEVILTVPYYILLHNWTTPLFAERTQCFTYPFNSKDLTGNSR